MTTAQKAAGRNFPRIFDNRSAISEWPGGSEASPTWAKSPVKILKKNNPGEVVKRDKVIVNVSDTNRSDHRASLASQDVPEWKVNEDGKFESKPTLSIPCRFEL
jgi:hypothetical protein